MHLTFFRLPFVALLVLTSLAQNDDVDKGFVTEYIYETQLSSNVAYVTMTGQSPAVESPVIPSTETTVHYETSMPEELGSLPSSNLDGSENISSSQSVSSLGNLGDSLTSSISSLENLPSTRPAQSPGSSSSSDVSAAPPSDSNTDSGASGSESSSLTTNPLSNGTSETPFVQPTQSSDCGRIGERGIWPGVCALGSAIALFTAVLL